MTAERRYWAVIPAAGAGARFGGEVPEQYLPLAGRPVIEWALRPFLARADVLGVVLVLSPGDADRGSLRLPAERIVVADGGAERSGSVLRGLEALVGQAAATDWVLVHDAARPCLTDGDLAKLLASVGEEDAGGLLAVPVGDTLKRAGDDRVQETVDRTGIWRALTPQMFRMGDLLASLRDARDAGRTVTVESSAMEQAGFRPRLVAGRGDNIKITRPEDLPLAEVILRQAGIA